MAQTVGNVSAGKPAIGGAIWRAAKELLSQQMPQPLSQPTSRHSDIAVRTDSQTPIALILQISRHGVATRF